MAETEQSGPVDAVIGLAPPLQDEHSLEATIGRIVQSSVALRVALVHPPYTPNGSAPVRAGEKWRLIADPQLAQSMPSLVDAAADRYRTIFGAAQKLGARACAVVVSDLSSTTVDWTRMLLDPIVEGRFDLVTPCYARHPFEAMINRAVVYPLVRALYGKRIRHPMGPDFGASSVLLERIAAGPKARLHALPSLAAEAVTNGMAICQAHLGPRTYGGPDWTNLSTLLSQVLGPLFLDVERYAAHWQRARGSQAIPEFGEPLLLPAPDGAPDVTRLIESFQLGARNLQEIWGVILPPMTLVELRRLVHSSGAGFRLPDATWAKVIYDFALAHRLRTISRDQMLRALTPIYLGWVASYALELEHASPEEAEQRLEQLCLVFESSKAYFVSRWRWPDRFNP